MHYHNGEEMKLLNGIVLLLIIFSLTVNCDKKEPTGPKSEAPMTDIDGNVYLTIKIGDQVWMAENLRVTHYQNGDEIPKATNNSEWRELEKSYCAYDYDETNVNSYGYLYNWHSIVDVRNIAPEGWHVPSNDEWAKFESFLGMSQEALSVQGFRGSGIGSKVKDNDAAYWIHDNHRPTNESGFSARPGSFCDSGGDVGAGRGSDVLLGWYAHFWSATESGDEAFYRYLGYHSDGIGMNTENKNYGFSVCLIKDSNDNVYLSLSKSGLTLACYDGAIAHLEIQSNRIWNISANADWLSVSPLDGAYDGQVFVTATSENTSGDTRNAEIVVSCNGLENQVITVTQEKPEIDTGTVEDIDGNMYKTVKIGDQWWMAENLKVTNYQNGDPIDNVSSDLWWSSMTEGAFCSYDNNEKNVMIYGRLYNWYAATDTRNIAPVGWHVPTDEDWKKLEIYLGMSQSEADATGQRRGTNEGSRLADDAVLWFDGRLKSDSAFGESDFFALPGGFRTGNGYYTSMGGEAHFWTSSNYTGVYIDHGCARHLWFIYSSIGRNDSDKQSGFSVRCVKD